MLAKFFCTFFLFSNTFLVSGQKYLNGIVQYLGQPIGDVTVYTSETSTCTDNLGRFCLHLRKYESSVYGNEIKIYTNHSILGFNEHACTIGNYFECNLNISKNPPNILINGIVKSELYSRALPGVEVRLIGGDVSIEPTITNKFGEFRFLICKNIIGDNLEVRLQVRDTVGFYQPKSLVPQLFELNSFLVIDMQPKNQSTIIVANYNMFNFLFSAGDLVTIKADGEISTNIIRRFNGNSPEGYYSNSPKINSGRYSIALEINHGTLMYRISGEKVWKALGREQSIRFDHSGYLEFQINTNKPKKIKGVFKLTLSY